jgi:hypothetical protein
MNANENINYDEIDVWADIAHLQEESEAIWAKALEEAAA